MSAQDTREEAELVALFSYSAGQQRKGNVVIHEAGGEPVVLGRMLPTLQCRWIGLKVFTGEYGRQRTKFYGHDSLLHLLSMTPTASLYSDTTAVMPLPSIIDPT